MRRWLFLLSLLCFACYKAAESKSPATPSITRPEDLASLEQQLTLDMQALGLPPEPQETAPEQPRTLPDSTSAGSGTLDSFDQAINAREEARRSKANRDGLFGGRRSDREAKKSEQSQCQRTCDLVDNICDAAERICQLTAQLPDDPDSPKRCERARNSCTRAKQQGESCGCGQ